MMRTFLEPLQALVSYEEARQWAARGKTVSVSGCIDAQKPQLILGIGGEKTSRLIIASGEQRARELLDAYRYFDGRARYFPARDILFYQSDVRGNAITRERMYVFEELLSGEAVIITTFDALMDRMLPPEVMADFVLRLHAGDTVDLEVLREKLVCMGYECSYQAEEPGQFAVRGGILDIYALTEEVPWRIELWGDEIDSIRSFSPESQRSIETLEEAVICPASELMLTSETRRAGLKRLTDEGKRIYELYRSEMKTQEAFRIREAVETVKEEVEELESIRMAERYLSYFYPDAVSFLDFYLRCVGSEAAGSIFLDEPSRCLERAQAVEQEFVQGMQQRMEKGYALPGQAKALFSVKEIAARLAVNGCVLLSALEQKYDVFAPGKSVSMQVKSVNAYNGSFELLTQDLLNYKKRKYSVVLLSGSRTRAHRMAEDLLEAGLTAFYSEDTDRIAAPGETMVLSGTLTRGFEYPELKFVVLTETDIFGAKKKKKKRIRRYGGGEHILGLEDLRPGDYVIHENHGLGVYRGIEQIEVNRTMRDYMKIEYDKGASLYVLATQLDLIQKYVGAEGKKPKLNKLGGQEWHRTRSRVQSAVQEIAQELVELYAARQSKTGFQYGEDTVWQREFEELFPYEETEDQQTAIAAVKADMQSTKIMDRLICGDVGFGKTEVAIRAAFKAVQEGKQVVYLVPTTILAQQHYNTFAQRMKDFPVNVELLCRFRTAAQQRAAIAGLKKGLVDIVIGTHRLLSKDVAFKDLGLLIIDEEQRFGVAHKEKIKQMKKDVDVLTLSATPIPRTLHMSMVGIRDMSVLEEPPEDRMPIQTYVLEYDEEMVREAIERELARGGQVYYVFNRVSQIADMAGRIAELVPQAQVSFAHGQMSERELEQVMYQFINGEIDVLVSTTIIETGLDISNVNTMIIHDSDQLGLSQLYQLRGRIGRSNRTAYAFLMYRRNKMLREVAEKRLSAIREFSELGSGIRIAMKDLELRGAGNLLGAQQHGHMEAVGYDLYCKMLNAAVQTAKGEEPEEAFETVLDINLDAYLPGSYISNEYQKLDLYKRIAAIQSEAERDELLDELIDRFGEPPRSAQSLLTVALLKARAHDAYLTEVREREDSVLLRYFSRAKIDVAQIPALLERHSPYLKFVPDQKEPYFQYSKNARSPEITELISQLLSELAALTESAQQA